LVCIATSIAAAIKRDSLTIRELQAEMQNATTDSGQETNVDRRKYFNQWIALVSKWTGYRIDKRKIMMDEFLDMNNMMNHEREIMRNRKAG
jgi:hypothetical protein